MYRKPAVAGVLLGAACGTLFFAVFLLPVWAVFYSRKSRVRFGVSLAAVAAVLMLAVALTSENTDSFVNKLVMTANWSVYRLFDAASPLPQQPIGTIFLRITLAALFFVLLVAMTVIPRQTQSGEPAGQLHGLDCDGPVVVPGRRWQLRVVVPAT